MSEGTSETSETALTWSVIEARGEDALTFLQGQLSQDLARLDERGAWALVLAPDSVVVTTCFVTSRPDGFDLVVPRELGEVALARLRRFLLRTKCTLDLRPVDAGPFGSLDEQIDASWPGVGEFASGLTPHAFGRDFVAATIAFDKGCFTGQELVGRLDARGSSVPWRLVRVRGASVEAIDGVLRSKGPHGPQGVTSASVREGRVVGLGIAHRTLLGALGDGGDDVEVVEVA